MAFVAAVDKPFCRPLIRFRNSFQNRAMQGGAPLVRYVCWFITVSNYGYLPTINHREIVVNPI